MLFRSPHVVGVKVLAVDPGKAFGHAYRYGDGEADIAHGHDTLDEDDGLRWRGVIGVLNRLARQHGPPDYLWFELSTWQRNALAMIDHGGFKAVLAYWCSIHGIARRHATPNQIKRHIAGHGRAQKPEIVRHVRALGFRVDSDDEADAIALLDLALAELARERVVERARAS